MEKITVKKAELIDKLKLNRANHRKIFEEAVIGYRQRVIELLEESLSRARAGKNPELRQLVIIHPVDQTKDYDRAIAMLEMSVDAIVSLDEQDFRAYVMDEWGWRHQFITSNAAYSQTASAFMVGSEPEYGN